MPFGMVENPKLSLALLKALLNNNSIETDVHYFDMMFMSMIGFKSYKSINGELLKEFQIDNDALLCDWLFSHFLYDKVFNENEIERVFQDRLVINDHAIDLIKDTIHQIPIFLRNICQNTNWEKYGIIGFTLGSSQVTASLCCAKLLKESFPELLIGIGGINTFFPMGKALLSSYKFLDYASNGEADDSFPEFVSRYFADDSSWKSVKGFTVRLKEEILDNGYPGVVENLDALPVPDYSDFSVQMKEYQMGSILSNVIPIETSRGCKWGQNKKCVFCGEPFQLIPHRKKSNEKVITEVEYLSDQLNCFDFDIADNYFEVSRNSLLIDHLIRSNKPYRISFSTRANLKRRDLRRLKSIVNSMLIGIESFDENTLNSMGKGTNILQNIAVLRWAAIYEINTYWNLIYGFENETKQSLKSLKETLLKIIHLPPPLSFIPVQIYRYSRIFNYPEEFGHSNLRPISCYYEVFSEKKDTVGRIAYFFESDNTNIKAEHSHELYDIDRLIESWLKNENEFSCYLHQSEDGFHIIDSRMNIKSSQHLLKKPEPLLLALCDSPVHISSLVKMIINYNINITEDELLEILSSLISNGFMVRERNRYLSIPLISDTLLEELKHV